MISKFTFGILRENGEEKDMRPTGDYQKIQIDSLRLEKKLGNTFLMIQPGSLCVFDVEAPSNSKHFHHCFELCLVTKGEGFFLCGGDRLEVKKGDVFIADPDVVHEIALAAPGKPEGGTKDLEGKSLHVMHFSLSILESDMPDKSCREESALRQFLKAHDRARGGQSHLMAHLRFIADYGQYKNRQSFILEAAILNLVLDSLVALTRARDTGGARPGNTGQVQSGEPAPPSSIMDAALTYIARSMGERIFLEDVARAANTSKRNLQLLFRRHLNATVNDYIIRRKMSVASSYLRMNFRVKDVGPKVGIADPARFCRVFKKYIGMSPKKYQLACAAGGVAFAAEIR